jgi:ceramide glucosyltransferase
LQAYLAEDFVMGQRLAQLGRKVVLSSCAIEHRIGSQALGPNLAHRLRWSRSTRRSRPLGYAGQVFTYALPLALLLPLWSLKWWPLSAAVIALRYLAAWRTSRAIQASVSYIELPVQDVASMLVWAAGFFGREIVWRKRRFALDRWGRFQAINERLDHTNQRRS